MGNRLGGTRLAAAFVLASLLSAARAQVPDTIRIGVLTDMSGANADATGPHALVAARSAAEDAASFLPAVRVEVFGADHANKADVASAVARDWISNGGVNMVVDVPVSSAGLTVAEAVRGAPRTVFIASGAGSSELAGPRCSPTTRLLAVKAAGGTGAPAVMAALCRTPPDDPVMGATVRPDGRVTHDFFLFQVKTSAKAQGPWDDYKPGRRIAAEEAFRPLSEGGCPLAR